MKNPAVEQGTAVRLLTHYFRVLFNATGTRMDGDVESEIADIIGHIVTAAQIPLYRRIEELEKKVYEQAARLEV